jgi:hypothetical protein
MDQFKLRLPAALRAALEQAVVRSGRSINGEVVARLEESVADDHAAGHLGRLLGRVMNAAGAYAMRHSNDAADPDAWPDDPDAYQEAVNAVIHVLNGFRPDAAPPIPGADRRSPGAAIAAMLVEDQPASAAVLIHQLGQRGGRFKQREPYDQRTARLFRDRTPRRPGK